MSYSFPDSLKPLCDFLRGLGADVTAFKTDRQAAFMAQQLVGSRVRFPPKGSDMTPTLLQIQKAIPAGGMEAGVTTSAPPASARSAASWAKQAKPRSPSQKSNQACDFSMGLHVFADGAAIPNPGEGGWGVVVYRDGVEIDALCGGDPQATNNQMELTALLNAIEVAKRLGGPVTIWSDSQYCVNGVNDWRHGWKKNGWARGGAKAKPENRILLNAELWQAIDEALAGTASEQVTVNWVKGHNGIVGNERADELAEQGRTEAANVIYDAYHEHV